MPVKRGAVGVVLGVANPGPVSMAGELVEWMMKGRALKSVETWNVTVPRVSFVPKMYLDCLRALESPREKGVQE